MIRPLAALAAAALPLLQAAPVTLNFGAQSSGGGLGFAENELPPGAAVLVGSFDLSPAELQAASTDHFTLLDHFELLASTEIGSFNGTPQNAPGAFSGAVTLDSSLHGGKRIALWVLDGPDFTSATAHLIFSAPGWTVPAFGSLSCQTSDPALLSDPAALLVSTRDPAILSPTLGGVLHQAIPLAHPDTSDHDRDGRPALLEHATGTDPTSADPLPLIPAPGTLRLTRRPILSGTATSFESTHYTYLLEHSIDLVGWQSFDGEVLQTTSTEHPENPKLEIIQLTLTQSEAAQAFYRLTITRR